MAQHLASGSRYLVDLGDDILDVIGSSLSRRDICNVSMCCKSLNDHATFEMFWLRQCEELGVLSSADLVKWRGAVSTYKALCRFLTSVKPLLGVWVHQNPEVGNVVYVMPGFASVVGCRVIPQKVGSSGIEDSPILWASVFEVISNDNGAPAFVLHGRVNDHRYLYPGTVTSIEKSCNVLLLEVERKEKSNEHLLYKESLHSQDTEHTTNMKCQSNIAFNKLSFEDTEKLLKLVTDGVGVQDPDLPWASLFPCRRGEEDRFQEDISQLSERREMLIEMRKLAGGYIDWTASHEQQFLPKPEGDHSEIKEAELRDFLTPGDKVGLTLKASYMKLSSYKTWPYMHYNVFALFKLHVQGPIVGQEYAGLWGGTFGPPLDKKPGKSLFFLNLCYYEKSGKRRLLAIKILDGSKYVKHPNGSAMFNVKVDKPSSESFPWSSAVKEAFIGKGIADGYGFRSPGSKPGSLFALEDGLLAFVWEETKSVLTLQRIDLEELLKKGQRVPAILPVDNFAYLSRSYSNSFVDTQT